MVAPSGALLTFHQKKPPPMMDGGFFGGGFGHYAARKPVAWRMVRSLPVAGSV